MKRLICLLSAIMLFGVNTYSGENEPSDVFGGSSVNAGLKINRYRGQFGNREHLYSGDILNGLYGYGYGLTALQTTPGVTIKLKANQDWTASAQGTKIVFETTPDGSTTPAEVFSIDDDGNVSVGGALAVSGATTGIIKNTPSDIFDCSYSSKTIVPTATFQLLYSTGAITLEATPNIATTTATNGQRLILLSSGTVSVSLQDDNTLSGSQIAGEAGDSTIEITTHTPVEFIFWRTKWFKMK